MKKILILGGGYASLSFIKSLNASIFNQFDFSLISKEESHYISVLLHEVVSKARNITLKYTDILPKKCKFIKDEILEIQEKKIIAKNGNYTYDILIIGLGFNRDDFKISGVEEHTLAMQNFNNCLDIHKKLQEISLKDKCEVIVCGAGFSGIELLADLALHFKNIKLKCVEAMPMILPMFNKNLAQFAKQYLEKLGVEFYLNAKIEKCEKNSLIFEKNGQKEKIEADLILYTAGVKGNKVIENSSFFKSQRSKIEVNEFLNPIKQNQTMENIFVLGDCCALKDEKSGQFFPSSAQLAYQQGLYLAKIFNTNNKIKFYYHHKTTICSLGNNYAIAQIGNIHLKGKLPSYLKKLVEFKWILKLIGLKALLK